MGYASVRMSHLARRMSQEASRRANVIPIGVDAPTPQLLNEVIGKADGTNNGSGPNVVAVTTETRRVETGSPEEGSVVFDTSFLVMQPLEERMNRGELSSTCKIFDSGT